MNFLLDTHTLLWFLNNDAQLPKTARQIIESDSIIWVSVASIWEIAIKNGLGKLQLPLPFEQIFPAQLALNSIEILPIEIAHLSALQQLPLHHRDPFDRLLIAQAKAQNWPLLSADAAFDAYEIARIW